MWGVYLYVCLFAFEENLKKLGGNEMVKQTFRSTSSSSHTFGLKNIVPPLAYSAKEWDRGAGSWISLTLINVSHAKIPLKPRLGP